MKDTGQADSLLSSCDEENRILGWRVLCFIDAGCSVVAAETLALAEADRCTIEGVIRAGCDPDLACSIFL